MIDVSEYKSLPSSPGVYRFYDRDKVLIYVGKARNIRSRVASYFAKNIDSPKTKQLVDLVCFIDYVVAFSEEDAFLLENNLIKENRPKYNILLKDAKAYPYIVITKEEYPRLLVTERKMEKGAFSFGPFSEYNFVDNIVSIVKDVFHVRTCNHMLTSENITKKKYKVCLKYHIGQCSGICEGLVSQDDYSQECDNAIDFLKGHIIKVKRVLRSKMNSAAKDMNYKLAQKYKEQVEAIDAYRSHSVVTNTKDFNVDVFYCEHDDTAFYVCYMIVKNGKIIFEKSFVEEIVF